jgi:hypothetical protein
MGSSPVHRTGRNPAAQPADREASRAFQPFRHNTRSARAVKQLLRCAFVVAMAQCALSTDTAGQDWSYGMRGGLTVSRFNGLFSSDPLTGYTAGLALGGSFHPIFGAQVELLVTRKTSSAMPEPILTGPVSISTVSLTYLQLPVLGRVFLVPDSDSRVRPMFYGGASFSLLLSCRHSMNGEDPFSNAAPGTAVSCDRNSALSVIIPFAHTHSSDLGLVGGIGVELSVGSRARITVDVRFERGLSAVDHIATPQARTETLTVGVQLSRRM